MMEISEEAWLPATLGAGRAQRSSLQPGRGAGAVRELGLLLAAPSAGTSASLRLWWAREEAPRGGARPPSEARPLRRDWLGRGRGRSRNCQLPYLGTCQKPASNTSFCLVFPEKPGGTWHPRA